MPIHFAMSPCRTSALNLIFVFAWLWFSFVLPASAAPTTAPASKAATTKPATRPANFGNTVELESKEFGLKFRVPKVWKRLALKSGNPDLIFAFQLPVGPATPNRAGSPVLKQFHIFLGLPFKGEASLEVQAKAVRDGILKQGEAKFREDAAVDFAGRSAWSFTWDAAQTVQVTETSGGKSNTRKEDLKIVKHIVVWLEKGKMCEIGYDVGPDDVTATEKLVAAVRDSFQSTAP